MKIVNYIGGSGSWGDLTPDTMNEKGLGGRETALIKLSENWAAGGHEVINFVPTKTPVHYGDAHYIDHRYTADHLKNLGADVLVSWEEPRIFSVPQIRDNVKLGVVEMQVANVDVSEEDDNLVDAYAVLSNWAGEYLLRQEPNIDEEKIVVFPNGVDLSRYGDPQFGLSKDRFEFYYSSSPDRGLVHLLRMWPTIQEEFPGSLLHVCYGVEHWVESVRWSHNMNSETALEVAERLQQPGVVYHGKVGQDRLARLQRSCDALLYPCDTMQPTETGCITVVEAGAATTPAIITNCDCLGTEFGEVAVINDLPLDYDSYIGSMVDVLGDETVYTQYQMLGRDMAEARDWGFIAFQWIEFFEDVLA